LRSRSATAAGRGYCARSDRGGVSSCFPGGQLPGRRAATVSLANHEAAVSHLADTTAVGLPARGPGPAHSPAASGTALACGASACTPRGQKVQPCADSARHCRLAQRPHRYSSPIRSTRYAAPTAGPHRSHVSLISPSPATPLPGPVPPLEHRRAGRTVQDVDLGGSPYLPHHPAEQGTDLRRVEGHAPGGITAAHAGLDDALVVAETTHRAPLLPVHLYRGARRPDLIHTGTG